MDDPEPISQQSTQSTSPWAAQQPFLQQLFERANGVYEGQAGATLNTGATANQQQARQNMIGGTIPGMENRLGGFNNAMSSALNATDVMNNPHLAGAMDAAIRPIFQNLREQVMPGITSDAVATGNVGSSRQGIAEGIASRGALDAAGNITSQMGSQAYGQGLQAQGNAMGMFGQGQQNNMMPNQLMEAIGGVQQNERMQGELFGLNQPNTALGNYANLVRGNFGGETTGNQVTPQGKSGGVGSAIGLAAQGAAAGATFGPWGSAAGAGLGLLSGMF
jgi:hypothetical protein